MALLKSVLIPLFVVGMIGSTLVVAITFTHDVIDFFSDEDSTASSEPRH